MITIFASKYIWKIILATNCNIAKLVSFIYSLNDQTLHSNSFIRFHSQRLFRRGHSTNSVLSSNTRVLLLESGRQTAKQPSESDKHSNRVSAVSPSSVEMFKMFSVWDDIHSKRVHPVSALYVEDGCVASQIHFKQLDRRSPIAHIVENDLIVSALHKCIRERCSNVQLKEGTIVEDLSVPENVCENVLLKLEGGQTIETPLLIAADGQRSMARTIAGIEYVETSYDQKAIVGTLEIQHASESAESYAWQRFMPLGPVALLPLGRQLCSLVWTVSTAEAERLLQLTPENFVEELNRTFSDDTSFQYPAVSTSLDFLGKALDCLPLKEVPAKRKFPHVVSLHHDDRAAFPLSLGYARDYVRSRVALIGDAAHRVHPLAGQGVNLGWSDVRLLTKVLEQAFNEGGDFGSLNNLRDFDSECQRRNVPIMLTIDCLNRLFSTDKGFCVFLRSVGFNVLDRFLPAKDLIVHLAS
uniref:FAD-binding domain-containing protein n=1 Tax=Globodera rostochiensis TaxID=31243 RepID=A0A914I6I7_GLORO